MLSTLLLLIEDKPNEPDCVELEEDVWKLWGLQTFSTVLQVEEELLEVKDDEEVEVELMVCSQTLSNSFSFCMWPMVAGIMTN